MKPKGQDRVEENDMDEQQNGQKFTESDLTRSTSELTLSTEDETTDDEDDNTAKTHSFYNRTETNEEPRRLSKREERQRNNKISAVFLETKTVIILDNSANSDMKHVGLLLQEMDRIGIDVNDTNVVRGAVKLGKTPRFKVTFQDEGTARRVCSEMREMALKEETVLMPEEVPRRIDDVNQFRLEGVPVELPNKMIQAYIHKYVSRPEVYHEAIEGYKHICSGARIIVHKGWKMSLTENRMWIAPGIFAWVKLSDRRPMTEWKPLCSNCLDEDHIYEMCPNEEKCNKCRQTGHKWHQCHKCQVCKKWGHNEGECERRAPMSMPGAGEDAYTVVSSKVSDLRTQAQSASTATSKQDGGEKESEGAVGGVEVVEEAATLDETNNLLIDLSNGNRFKHLEQEEEDDIIIPLGQTNTTEMSYEDSYNDEIDNTEERDRKAEKAKRKEREKREREDEKLEKKREKLRKERAEKEEKQRQKEEKARRKLLKAKEKEAQKENEKREKKEKEDQKRKEERDRKEKDSSHKLTMPTPATTKKKKREFSTELLLATIRKKYPDGWDKPRGASYRIESKNKCSLCQKEMKEKCGCELRLDLAVEVMKMQMLDETRGTGTYKNIEELMEGRKEKGNLKKSLTNTPGQRRTSTPDPTTTDNTKTKTTDKTQAMSPLASPIKNSSVTQTRQMFESLNDEKKGSKKRNRTHGNNSMEPENKRTAEEREGEDSEHSKKG